MTKQSIKLHIIFQILPILFISLISIIIYSNTLDSPFVFDDSPNITENSMIRMTDITLPSMKHAARGYASHRPIPNLSFAINYYLGRYNVQGYHSVNIAIHLINGTLVYLLAYVLFTQVKGRSRETRVPIQLMALFASLIFVAHPINTQSVTYIVQRMNSMAVMFYLLSFFLYIKARLSTVRWKRWTLFFGGILSGILALGSKEIAATLPFIILLYEYYFFQDLKGSWLKKNIPYLIIPIIVLAALVLIYMGKNPLNLILSSYGRRDFNLIERVLTQFRVIIVYISLLILPLPSRLNLIHHIDTSHSLIQPITTLICLAIIVALLVLSIYWAKKKRLISFCILWFFINLAMESSFIGLEMIFEHRLYLPMVGFCLLVAYSVYPALVQKRILTAALCGGIIVMLGYGTYVRNRTWRDEVTLWSDVVKKNPLSHRGYNNLGMALSDKGHFKEAIDNLSLSLKIRPDFVSAHNNLGLALEGQGKTEEAIKHYTKALSITPDFVSAHNNLGLALEGQGKINEAIYHFKKVLKIEPRHVRAHINLGLSLFKQGKIHEAVYHYKQVLLIDSKNIDAHMNLGVILGRQGKVQEAIYHYSEALSINPDSAEIHYNLAGILNKQGNTAKAIDHYNRALDIRPDFPEAHNNIGLTLVSKGKLQEAISHYREALRIRPDNVETHINLGVVLLRQGKIKEGAMHFIQALRIRPDNPDAHFYLGSTYVIIGRKDLAMGEYRVLEKIRPDLAKILLTRINQGMNKKTR